MPEDSKPSVFGYVDQAEVIKQLEVVSDDDLSSCFFGDSLQDVENAATDIFDIGVRDGAESDGPAASHPFAVPAGGPATPPPVVFVAVPASTSPAPTALSQDEKARQAFILGGPTAVGKD